MKTGDYATEHKVKKRKNWRRRILLFVGGIGLSVVALLWMVTNQILTPNSGPPPPIPTGFAKVESRDWQGAIASKNLNDPTAKVVVIFAHGMKADQGFFAPAAQAVVADGHAAIILAMPGHPRNPDRHVGFGVKESKLIRKVAEAVKPKKVVLVGCSLGGAAAWLASESPAVDGVVTEAAFTRLAPAARAWLSGQPGGRDAAVGAIIKFMELRTGVSANDVNPVDSARRWPRSKPALVIHDERDALMPENFAIELAEASGATRLTIQAASHANGQFADPKAYNEAVLKLVRQVRASPD